MADTNNNTAHASCAHGDNGTQPPTAKEQRTGEQRLSLWSTMSFRRPEPVYDDIGMHPFPSQSAMNAFPVELKEYYLKVLEYLETGYDLKPASEIFI